MLRKCVGKFLDCGQPYRVLHMQIVLGHIHIRVTDNALDRRKINTQHLHLGNVGMPTTMGRQNPYPLNGFQSLFELIPEVRGIAGHSRFLGRFPDVLIGRIPKQSCTVADVFGDRDIAVSEFIDHHEQAIIHIPLRKRMLGDFRLEAAQHN